MSAIAAEIVARLERVQAAVNALQHRSAGVQMSSAGGEVEIHVDAAGRLVDLRLTDRAMDGSYTTLERLINDTWHAAIVAASRDASHPAA